MHDEGEKKWWKEAVFYQVYPRSFLDTTGDGNGDIRGIISKLDYLKELGITATWLSPVYKSPMVDNGYDIADYYAIDPIFGSMDDMDDLIREIHSRDMKLIMDLVVNHTSDKHAWFQESRLSKNNPKRDWYIWRDGKDGKEPNNWASDFGGSAWTLDEATGQYYLHLFSSGQPDLNWENPEVKEAIFAMMRWWLAKGVDGFRMDVVNFIKKAPGLPDAPRHEGDTREYIHGEHLYANQPGMHEILHEMNTEVLRPSDAIAFGEMYFLTPDTALEYVGYDRRELNMLYQYPIVEQRGNWPGVKYQTKVWYDTFKDNAWNMISFGNHDSPRAVSIFGDDVSYHEKSAMLIAGYLLTAPGTPFIYQGEEIGMTNVAFESVDEFTDIKLKQSYEERVGRGEDPEFVFAELKYWSRDNARTGMQWDDSNQAGFCQKKPWFKVCTHNKNITVLSEEKKKDSILHFYKELISLRKKYPVLVYGDYDQLRPSDWTVWAHRKSNRGESIITVFNFSSMPESIEKINELAGGELLLSNYTDVIEIGERESMRPWEVRLYYIKKQQD